MPEPQSTTPRPPTRPVRSAVPFLLLALTIAAAPAAQARAEAQAPNYRLPPSEIQRLLAAVPFEITGIADNRWDGDRTQRAALRFDDGTVLPVKWARSAEGGFALNNEPRYELAAYRLQQLFLDPADHVVPPTALRAVPLAVYRQLDPDLEPTFEGTASVLVVLQYWLDEVDVLTMPDTARLDDDAYARRLANLNLLTYLIGHADSNYGNVLISRTGEPRMFAVDNGVAFSSPESPRGTYWKELRVARLPGAAVDRLRRVDRETLAGTLGTVARLRVGEDGRLVPTDDAPGRRPYRGVQFEDGFAQLGLTDAEIDALWNRLHLLIDRVDRGEIETF